MKSVWYEMGLREGKFRGVEQTKFLNTVYSFYHTLQSRCRQTADEGWELPFYYDLSFTGRPKWNPGKNGSSFETLVEDMCRFPAVPFGTPVKEAFWKQDAPAWDETVLAPQMQSFIGEEVLPYPGRNRVSYGAWRRKGEFAWEKQQYKIIQQMRYCIVPLLTSGFGADAAHRGFVDHEDWKWGSEDIEIKLHEYWQAGESRIGIYAKEKISGDPPPIEGCFWVPGETAYRVKSSGDVYRTVSTVRICGMTDLARHPDFEKYFDL